VLAPRVISLMAEAEVESAATESESEVALDFSGSMPGKPPLLVPREFEEGFVPELLDLQNLFRGASQTPD
jgi:hypothetical protein